MKKRILCSVLVLFLSSSFDVLAEEPLSAGEVGIDEKLGEKVPLNLELLDEEGKKVTLKELIDKPTVLTLNYFRCGGICTPMLNSLTDTLNKIDLEPGKDFRVVTVSFDSRDTPEIAAHKRQNYLKLMKRPFPPTAWRFLTGEGASTMALANSLGFKFKKRGEDFIHPGGLVVLSAEGKITRYMYGITFLPFDLEMAIGEASKGLVRPTISKALRLCFSYDPAGRRYVFNVTRVAGSAILTLAGGFLVILLLKGRLRSRTEGLSS